MIFTNEIGMIPSERSETAVPLGRSLQSRAGEENDDYGIKQ